MALFLAAGILAFKPSHIVADGRRIGCGVAFPTGLVPADPGPQGAADPQRGCFEHNLRIMGVALLLSLLGTGPTIMFFRGRDQARRPGHIPRQPRWVARLAMVGVVIAFMAVLSIPGWFALRDYQAWARGEKKHPTHGLVWAALGLLGLVLLVGAGFVFGGPTRPAP
jgi:hypothetical protein